jgi:hypothetical protein
MRFAYKPFGFIASLLGGLIASTLFKRGWALLAGEATPPSAKDEGCSWGEVVLAAALEGAVFGGVKAAIDRAGASGFAKLTGVWPGRPVDEKRA